MKRYKLLKDTPTLKAGTIFEEVVGDFDGLRALTRITPVGAKTSPHFTIKDIDNFNEWFEEIPEEYERWRGEKGDGYYFLSSSGNVCHEADIHNDVDNYRYNAGIYGRTKQELEAKLKYNIARQVLLDDAEGEKCIEHGKNWHAYYDTITKTYHPVCSISYFYPGIIYFRTEEALKKSLKEHEKQWEIVRKYEMGEM